MQVGDLVIGVVYSERNDYLNKIREITNMRGEMVSLKGLFAGYNISRFRKVLVKNKLNGLIYPNNRVVVSDGIEYVVLE